MTKNNIGWANMTGINKRWTFLKALAGSHDF